MLGRIKLMFWFSSGGFSGFDEGGRCFFFWLKAGVLFLQGLAAHPVTAIMWGIKSMDAQKWTCTCPLCWYFHHAQKEELIIPY